ncbi:MAG: DNA alkylation repair protein, partial [Sideroxyarcus sp.]|nr:DNA alkylation repair protein [Sideroxyarcus sp.]
TPQRRDTIKHLKHVAMSDSELLEFMQALWMLPEREYKYVAIDLLAYRYRQRDLSLIPQLLEMAQIAPWWETIDGLCSVIGDMLRHARNQGSNAQMLMDAAITHESLWIRRIAMTHQLGWRLETDTERLFRYAEYLAPEEDFFIRKAIGWALRDYARWNPEAVQKFLAEATQSFSPLSLREARKHFSDSE